MKTMPLICLSLALTCLTSSVSAHNGAHLVTSEQGGLLHSVSEHPVFTFGVALIALSLGGVMLRRKSPARPAQISTRKPSNELRK